MHASLMCPSRRNPADEFSPLEDVGAYEHEGGWWWSWLDDRCGGPFPTEDAAVDAGVSIIGAELREEAEREAAAEAHYYGQEQHDAG